MLSYLIFRQKDINDKISNDLIRLLFKTHSGELVVHLEKYPAALFNFINGSIAAERKLSDKQCLALGELLGRIHKAKDIIGESQLKEDFKYKNKNSLLQNIEEAESLQNDNSEHVRKVAQLLIENKDKIVNKLKKLEDLGDQLRAQNLDFVICHGEPHNWNIMVSDAGEVFLIDWDDSLFAPKEKDLGMIKGDSVAFDGYKHIVGECTLNQDVFTFYDMKWNISEIEDWSSRIFSKEENELQNKHYLEQLISEVDDLNA